MLNIIMWNNYVFPPLYLPGGSGFGRYNWVHNDTKRDNWLSNMLPTLSTDAGNSHQNIDSVAEPERFFHGDFFTTPDCSENFHLGAMFSPVAAPNTGFLTAPVAAPHQGAEHPLPTGDAINTRASRTTQIRGNVSSDQRKRKASKDSVCKKQLGSQLYKKLKIMCSEKLHDLPLRETTSTQTQRMKAPVRRSRKLGDKITALQQLVAPFGKTDTASVLREVAISIKDLHEQIRVLTEPYFRKHLSALDQMSYQAELMDSRPSFLDFKSREGGQGDLQSRGLCLVAMSSPIMSFMNQACNQGRPDRSAGRSGFRSY